MTTNETNKEFKELTEYPGYAVNRDGEVKSLKNNRILKQSKQKSGYVVVNLKIDGKTKTVYVHRLVASAFCPNPDSQPTVNHRNEKKEDNRSCNLQYCSYSYNKNYSTTGNSPISQYTITGEFVARYVDMNEILATYPNYNRTNINMNLNQWTNTAYGYVWRYDLRDYADD